ncbi:MAG: PDZ domain-containing protein [Planctomycetota bacterium]|jgi:hypothetical protein
MDNNRKLTEGLLKADGIDPAGATESERAAFGMMLDEQSKIKQSKPGIAWPDTWRIIMKRRSTRLAAAAVIIVAAAIGLNILGGPDIASVALADVAREIEQIKNCVFKKTTTGCLEDDSARSFDSLVYYTDAAVREDVFDGEKVIHQAYVRFSEGILVAVNHKTKEFTKMDLTDEDMDKLSPVSPKNIVNLILGKGKYKELGRKTVDGVVSEGFEFSDTRAMLSVDKEKIKNIVTRLWVDVKTNLPIRVEAECVLVGDSKANLVMSAAKWDVELEPDFFEPKIPVDYIRPEQRGLIGINLENWPTVKVVAGMPAEEAGVKDGDVVLKVDGNEISHVKSSGDALNLLTGKAGERVSLAVKRGEQILTFEIERAPLPKD